MIRLIMEKEIKEIINSKKFIVSMSVCLLMVLITFFVGTQQYKMDKLRYDDAVAENLKSMKGVTDWRMVKHKIFLPPDPVASLVNGISNDIGRTIDMRGRGELVAMESKYEENPIYAAFRFLDLTFLFQFILSLFAILFSYNLINGEKEQGTLRLIFSNSIPRDKYIIGKLLGANLAILIPLFISFLIGFLVVQVSGVPMNFNNWMKLVTVMLTGMLYISVFITIAVFVSVRTKRSSESFVILLVFWIFATMVVPKASVLIAGRLTDVPSVDKVNSQKSAFNRQLSLDSFKKMGNFKPTNDANAVDEFMKFMDKNNQERDEKFKVFANRVNLERENKLGFQEKISLAISRISPATCFTLAASDLASTSIFLRNNFIAKAADYQNIFAEFQRKKTGMTTGGGMMMIISNDNDVKEINPQELPKFDYKYPGIGESLSHAIPDISLLLLFNILFFAGAYFSFLKYDLR